MEQVADNSFEARLAQLEAQVRSMTAGNLTDRASVVDAAGNVVPMANLAFGQVTAVVLGVGVQSIGGVAGQAGSGWIYGEPSVEVLVRGGRLRVDWAALMALAGGNASASANWCYSYAIDYRGAENAKDTETTRIVGPDYYRSIMQRDTSLTQVYAECGNWFMHTGLAVGWYKVTSAWSLGYASTTGTQPHGYCDNPRIAATPF